MLRIIRAPIQRLPTEIGKAAHLARQAAISPAVRKMPNPRLPGFNSIRTAMSIATKAPAIAMPAAHTTLARPNDGNSCSALDKGGPTARAPQEGHPRQRSPLTPEPQEGHISKRGNLWRNQECGTKLE